MTLFNRHTRRLLDSRMSQDPVVLIQGPRSVGKSTLLNDFAKSAGVEVIDLDHLPTRVAVTQDPGFFISGPGPVCIDEYQKAPELLDSIKFELGKSSAPGKFLLAGSTNFNALPKGSQALTGRLSQILVEPLTQSEIDDVEQIEITESLDPSVFQNLEIGKTPREDYVERLTRGGFPLAVSRKQEDRTRWADDYLALALGRDIEEVASVRAPKLLARVLELLAARTAQIVSIESISDASGLTRITADKYVQLLESVFLIHDLPAWGTTLGSRVSKRSKVHVVDSLIASRLLRMSQAKLNSKDPSALSQFGHLLESFAVGELRRLAAHSSQSYQVGHWRQGEAMEVDFVLEDEGGQVTGIEVKASTSANLSDAQGLKELSKKLGSSFNLGVVLYLGPLPVRLEEKIWAVPLDVLWSQRK